MMQVSQFHSCSHKWTSKFTWTNSLQAQVQVFNPFKSCDKIRLQQYMLFFGPSRCCFSDQTANKYKHFNYTWNNWGWLDWMAGLSLCQWMLQPSTTHGNAIFMNLILLFCVVWSIKSMFMNYLDDFSKQCRVWSKNFFHAATFHLDVALARKFYTTKVLTLAILIFIIIIKLLSKRQEYRYAWES